MLLFELSGGHEGAGGQNVRHGVFDVLANLGGDVVQLLVGAGLHGVLEVLVAVPLLLAEVIPDFDLCGQNQVEVADAHGVTLFPILLPDGDNLAPLVLMLGVEEAVGQLGRGGEALEDDGLGVLGVHAGHFQNPFRALLPQADVLLGSLVLLGLHDLVGDDGGDETDGIAVDGQNAGICADESVELVHGVAECGEVVVGGVSHVVVSGGCDLVTEGQILLPFIVGHFTLFDHVRGELGHGGTVLHHLCTEIVVLVIGHSNTSFWAYSPIK